MRERQRCEIHVSRRRKKLPLIPVPTELEEGINSVVAPVAALLIDVRSGWWIDVFSTPLPWDAVEYSRRADRRLSMHPWSSSAVKFSRIPLIWSSVRTVSVMMAFAFFSSCPECSLGGGGGAFRQDRGSVE